MQETRGHGHLFAAAAQVIEAAVIVVLIYEIAYWGWQGLHALAAIASGAFK